MDTIMEYIEFFIINYITIFIFIVILFIPAFIIYKIFKSIVIRFKQHKNVKTFNNIAKPNWELTPTKEGDMIYKFKGFSNFDSKAKYLEIDKKNILNEEEVTCWNIINFKIKINQYITILPKFPIKELITITDEEKLFKGWKEKMEPIIIDFLILDNELNPIAGIHFKKKSEYIKFIDDIYYNIRIPVFWIDKDKDTFEYQLEDIFNRINDYFIQANLIKNERKFSKL